MLMRNIKTDYVGALASLLCLLHCMATPFLFVVKTCSNTCCVDAPIWWKAIDYLFVVISFFSVYYATKGGTKNWLRVALWSTWMVLLLTILNEAFNIASIPEKFIYIPSLIIVVLHLYNYNYRKCTGTDCCVSQTS